MRALLLAALVSAPADLVETIERHARDPHGQERRVEAIARLGTLATPDTTRVLERLLDDAYPHVRDAAAHALDGLAARRPAERAASLDFLGDALLRRKDETQARIAAALGRIGDARAVPALLEALRAERDAHAAEAIAESLARLGDPRAVPELLAKARRSEAARAACVRALGALPGGAEAALAHRDAPDDAVRAAVVDALVAARRPVLPERDAAAAGELEGIALADALPVTEPASLARRRAAELLEHPSWRVRAAAVAGIVARRDASLVGDLVDSLAREDGRLRRDAWLALRTLTGKDLGPDPAAWRALGPQRALPPQGASPPEDAPRLSRAVAFVFDGPGALPDTEGCRFDVFVARWPAVHPPAPRVERAFGGLLEGEEAAAADWLARRDAGGFRAPFDALAAALEADVDTIVYVAGGPPQRGAIADPARVVAEIARRNRWRRTVVHAFGGGDFGRALAAATGGSAREAPPPAASSGTR